MKQSHSKFFKPLTLALLSIPLLLMITYIDSQNGFSFTRNFNNHNNLAANKDQLIGRNQQESFDMDSIISSILKAIQIQKILGNSKDVEKCDKFVKQGQMTLADLHIPPQICQQNTKQIPHKFFVTILLQNPLPTTLQKQVTQTFNKIRQFLSFEISSNIQILEESILPEYLANKIYHQNYIHDVAEQIANTRYGKQCRFQWKDCQNNIFIVGKAKSEDTEKGWYEVGEVIFVSQEYLIEAIVSLFSNNMPNITMASQLNRLQQLSNLHKKLLMIEKLPFPAQISSNALQHYLKQVQNFIAHNGPFPVDILQNRQVINIDIMASEYKLGIFLPLFLILTIFPCWNILKI